MNDPFMLLFTGGTSGTLKAAIITYRQDAANALLKARGRRQEAHHQKRLVLKIEEETGLD